MVRTLYRIYIIIIIIIISSSSSSSIYLFIHVNYLPISVSNKPIMFIYQV